jgi:hypothetical protein
VIYCGVGVCVIVRSIRNNHTTNPTQNKRNRNTNCSNMALSFWTMSHFPHHWYVALVQPPRIVCIHNNTTMSHRYRLDSNRLQHVVWSWPPPPRIRCTTTTTTISFPYDHNSNVWNPQYLSQQRSRLFSFVAAVPSSIWRRRRLSLPWHGYGVPDQHDYHHRHGIRTQRLRSPLPYRYPNVTSFSSTVDPTPERMFTTTTTTTATTSNNNNHTSHDDHHDAKIRMVPMSDVPPDAAAAVMNPKDTMVPSTNTAAVVAAAATIKHEQQQQPILGTVSKDDVHKEEVKHKRLSEVNSFYVSCWIG